MFGGKLPRTRVLWMIAGALVLILSVVSFYLLRPSAQSARATAAFSDFLHDVEAGRRAGCRTVFLDVGHETEWDLTPDRTPHVVAGSLLEAAHAITGAAVGSEATGG